MEINEVVGVSKNTKRLNVAIQKAASFMGLLAVDVMPAIDEQCLPTRFSEDCLLLTGENLHILGGLASKESENVDFIYIDPPYNTAQEFIYSDNKTRPSDTVWGKHHDWLAFMLPRIIAGRELLKDSGVMAISIDDFEYAHLKILMDLVFRSRNYIGTMIVCRSKNGRGSKHHLAVNHEYVLLYGKTNKVVLNGIAECESKIYNKKDEYGEYKIDGLFRKKGDDSLKEDRPNMHFPLYYSDDGKVYVDPVHENLKMCLPRDTKGIDRRWLWGIEKTRTESWKLFASKTGTIYVKNYKSANKRVKLRSILDKPEYLSARATTELKQIYGGEKVFETPKPLGLLRDLIGACAPTDGLILDFFAGTGTTAEAAWQLNQDDGGKRKVVLIEQDHLISKDHVAAKRGFKRLSDLAEFRLKAIQERDPNYRYLSLSPTAT